MIGRRQFFFNVWRFRGRSFDYLRYEGYVVDLVESLSCKMADSNLEIKALQTNNISYNSILGGLYIWSLIELN